MFPNESVGLVPLKIEVLLPIMNLSINTFPLTTIPSSIKAIALESIFNSACWLLGGVFIWLWGSCIEGSILVLAEVYFNSRFVVSAPLYVHMG
jgi:hypothetical protein